jgi:hypothetical protein
MAVALIAKHNRRAQVGRTDGVDMLECGAEKSPLGRTAAHARNESSATRLPNDFIFFLRMMVCDTIY